MQARVTCPACQSTLALDAAHGDGTVLRCPQCRRDFAIRLPAQRRPAPAAAPRPTPPPTAAAPRRAPQQPSGLRAPPPARPLARLPASSAGPNNSLLWIGISAGAAVAVAGIVLVVIIARMATPANDAQTVAQNVAGAPAVPAGSASSGALASNTAPATAVSTAPATGGSTAPAAGQPVSSVTPSSPFPTNPLPAAPSAPGSSALAYRFNPGEEYAYSFTVKAEISGTSQQVSGMCTLTPSRDAAPAEFAEHQKTGQGSGSGFIVTSDGYVVTCAHVVEGSTKLEVVVAGQNYPAQVVAFDKEHDLAVVRIAAANLPTISLANSDAVELAEEVRAVGYPLSTLLGESVKITRGTIAGVVNTSGRKLFQVDASINPGNSGGPLVNEMGHVVGVASAKLASAEIDGVGFAVPASEVLSLLRSKGISPPSATASQKLDGPALARRVTPAVALIRVTIGPGGYGAANRLVLDYSGHVSSNGSSSTAGNTRVVTIASNQSDRGKLLLSERGELLDTTSSNVQLPYLLGPVGQLVLEPLPADNQRTWQTQSTTALTQVVGEESSSPISMRFRNRGRNPFRRNQTKVVVTPAVETSSYELTGTSGDLLTIVKRYTFQTLDPAGTPPVAKVTGEGTITFNRAKGYAEKMDYKATMVRSSGNVSVTVPFTMEWHRVSAAELAQMRAQGQANLEAAKQASANRAVQVAKQHIGEDTEFIGGSGGGGTRSIDDGALLYGIECEFGEWAREKCLKRIVPIFSPNQRPTLPGGAVAREGYAVGAVNVHAQTFVNGIQLVFMRVKADGRLDPKDSYTSGWIGARRRGSPRQLTGGGDAIIGVHVRRGLVVDALALVVNRGETSRSRKNGAASGSGARVMQ
jgi:S1-C subfamily serine protease